MTRTPFFTFLFVLAVAGFVSCASEEKKAYYIAEHKDEVTGVLRDHPERMFGNSLLGMEHLGLTGQQGRYYRARLDFFIATLNEDKQKYKTFFKIQNDYYRLFPENQRHYFYWSRDNIDFQILHRLGERFGEVALPADFCREYFSGLVKVWEESAPGGD